MESMLSEKDLLTAIRAGDEKAFASFYSNYSKKIRVLLLFLGSSQEVADDLTQDTFTKVWVTRSKLNDESSILSFTRSIARNLFIDHFRKNQVRTRYNTAFTEDIEKNPNPHDLMANKELKLILSDAVAQLPKEKQVIFNMSRVEGHTYTEIAQNLQTTPKAVERHMARSLHLMRNYILSRLDIPVKLIWIIIINRFN